MCKAISRDLVHDICHCVLEMLKYVRCRRVSPPSCSLHLYLAVSIFCHRLALLSFSFFFYPSLTAFSISSTHLYITPNSCMVGWKLSARTVFQDKVEVSEWTKIKSNFSKKITIDPTSPNCRHPRSPCPSSASLTCTSSQSDNLTQQEGKKRGARQPAHLHSLSPEITLHWYIFS